MKLIKTQDIQNTKECVFCNKSFDEFGGKKAMIEYNTINPRTGDTVSVTEPFNVCNDHITELK